MRFDLPDAAGRACSFRPGLVGRFPRGTRSGVLRRNAPPPAPFSPTFPRSPQTTSPPTLRQSRPARSPRPWSNSRPPTYPSFGPAPRPWPRAISWGAGDFELRLQVGRGLELAHAEVLERAPIAGIPKSSATASGLTAGGPGARLGDHALRVVDERPEAGTHQGLRV
jgi:hypothetical protein